jgi:hypothetical protein
VVAPGRREVKGISRHHEKQKLAPELAPDWKGRTVVRRDSAVKPPKETLEKWALWG